MNENDSRIDEAQAMTTYRPRSSDPIGVMDSGVGGLSVLVHLREQLPSERILYFADQAHIPYGPRPPEQVRDFTARITQFLLEHSAKLIVVACNTASAAALDDLRQMFPEVPFVGMEPAVKPAALTTRNGKVGVLATPSTLNSNRYAALMARFAAGIEVYEDPCVGLVQLIEAGVLDASETRDLLRRVLDPMLAAGVDTLVLGCTHYPFVRPLLEELVGERVSIIDPAPAVARHTRYVLQQRGLNATGSPESAIRCFTSGSPESFDALARVLTGYVCRSESIRWRADELVAPA